ncbi:MAG: 50S ribosomal protein L30 [Candidatus Thermoplasmatota archaeon]
MMTYAVVRVRSDVNVKPDIKETLRQLRLHRINHCILVPETPPYKGMLQKAKDYITWGEVSASTLALLLSERGELDGARITDEVVSRCTPYNDVRALGTAIAKGDAILAQIKGAKPVLRLHPPRGGYEGIKRSFRAGGALGYRGKGINELLLRMLGPGGED